MHSIIQGYIYLLFIFKWIYLFICERYDWKISLCFSFRVHSLFDFGLFWKWNNSDSDFNWKVVGKSGFYKFILKRLKKWWFWKHNDWKYSNCVHRWLFMVYAEHASQKLLKIENFILACPFKTCNLIVFYCPFEVLITYWYHIHKIIIISMFYL